MRGYTWCVYEDDFGRLWGLKVDSDSAQQPSRGWLTASIDTTNPFPRGWLPRQVVGVDAVGHTRSTRIGRLDAALWTGSASSWVMETNDGQLVSVTVTARVAERTTPRPGPG